MYNHFAMLSKHFITYFNGYDRTVEQQLLGYTHYLKPNYIAKSK